MKRFKIFSAMALALVLSIFLAASVAASSQSSKPSNLSAEICGDAVCLDWTPGNSDFDYQTVLFWEGNDFSDRNSGGRRTVGPSTGQLQVSLDALNIEPSENHGETVAFSFQVIGFEYNPQGAPFRGNSNMVTLSLTRPVPAPPPVHRVAPSDLSAELCGEAICLNWTQGTGDFTYQEIRFWNTDDPSNIWYGGGRIVNKGYSEWEYQISDIQNHIDNVDAVSYTFQVLAVTRHMGKKVYIGESNTATAVVPAHLIHLAYSH